MTVVHQQEKRDTNKSANNLYFEKLSSQNKKKLPIFLNKGSTHRTSGILITPSLQALLMKDMLTIIGQE